MIAPCLIILGLLAAPAWPTAAQPFTDANLVTAVDVSGSIKASDEHLEIEGLARAVVDPRFLQAIARGYHGRIGFTVFTWSDGEFVSLVPWTQIGSQADAEQVARQLRQARGPLTIGYNTRLPAPRRPWRTGYPTNVSTALQRAIEISAEAPFASRHQVINICANGTDNVGYTPDAARDRANELGLIVNGLVLGTREDAPETADYFREHVQVGPGSFVIVAHRFDDIANAMLSKFLIELAALEASPRSRAGAGS